MRTIFLFLFPFIGLSQTYFFEDFNYKSYNALDSLYQNKEKNNVWTTHFSNNIDITENGLIDVNEEIKKTSIVKDPLNSNNNVIKFELHKIAPRFYAKYSCDNRFNSNLFSEEYLDNVYVKENDTYCFNCKDSSLGITLSEYRNQMNRNEIAVYGPKRKMYKPKRDYWFGIKTLVDKEHQLDTIRNGEIITQFHLIDPTGNPPVALSIVNGRYLLTIIKNNDGKGETFDLGNVEKNVWTEWMYHLRLSKKENKGLVEVWKNGKKVVSTKGKNVYKNAKYYLKIGIYKWGWWDCTRPFNYSQKKIISYDDVWVDKKPRIKT